MVYKPDILLLLLLLIKSRNMDADAVDDLTLLLDLWVRLGDHETCFSVPGVDGTVTVGLRISGADGCVGD